MKDIGRRIAMDGLTAANLQKALESRVATRIPASESALKKGLTSANLQSGLASVPKPSPGTGTATPTTNSTGTK